MDDNDFKTQLELEEQERVRQQNAVDTSNPHIYRDPNDGTVYEWDYTRQAWFPKVTEEFMAAYQANYGQEYSTQTSEAGQSATAAKKRPESSEPETTNKQPRLDSAEEDTAVKPEAKPPTEQPPGWFEVDDQHNTNVYVSNLPEDITEEEFIEFMSKCGIIMKDPDTGKLKLKLYRDENGRLKGDARCCYIKVESVDLALKILDGYSLRDKKVQVQRAKFQMKGDYDPTKKPRKKKNKDKKKIQQMQAKLLDWRPDRFRGERLRHERTVIIKNMFDPKEFEEDVTLITEYQSDVKEEASKFGVVKKVVIYDRHPDGVVSVTFQEAEMADACIEAFNGRWFAGRRLTAEAHDGRTKYNIQETQEELDARLKKWESYLEAKEEKEKKDAADAKKTDTA